MTGCSYLIKRRLPVSFETFDGGVGRIKDQPVSFEAIQDASAVSQADRFRLARSSRLASLDEWQEPIGTELPIPD